MNGQRTLSPWEPHLRNLPRLLCGAIAIGALALVTACSPGATGRAGTGGNGGGGARATGGALSTGGATASGGGGGGGGHAPASGGAPSSGGMSATGGAAATGGSSTGGAVAATGGTAANGGALGTGGARTGGAGAGSGGSPANQVDVYLLGGQSNATGQGYAKNIPPTFAVDTNVMLYHSPGIVSGAAARTWLTLRPASEGTDGCNLGLRFGPELGFGNAMRAHTPERPIYLIKHATSNTGLAVDWAPGTGVADSARLGPEFQTFVTTVGAEEHGQGAGHSRDVVATG